jgi:hypothetical protein
MPKGPNGEKRPADTNACAVMVAKIATGEVEEQTVAKRGSAGGKARAEQMSAQERKEIAKRAAGARWNDRRRAMTEATTQTLAERYRANQTEGVIDVKFLLKNECEFSDEEAIVEHEAWNQAVLDGEYDVIEKSLDRWKEG